jgi:hypothetical protein
MNFTIPAPLQQEHEVLHGELHRATRAGGEAGERSGRHDIVAFAGQLAQHARTEEEVMYTAAVLVGRSGRHVRLLLAQRGDRREAA